MVPRPDSVPDVDIVSHDVYERGIPHDGYARLRAEAPVAWINETPQNGHHGAGFWAVTRWDDLVAVHKDWRTWSSEVGGTEIEELEPDAIVARRTMLETDPPRHTQLRQLVNPPFSRASVQTYAEAAHHIVDDVVRRATELGEVDAVEHVARDIPIRMLVSLLGIPEADADQLFEWADQIVYHADPDYSAAVVDRVDTDAYRLLPFRSPVTLLVFDALERIIRTRTTHAPGDVISVLQRATDDGLLTVRERDTFFLLILIAGNETTRHSLSHALIAFAEHPEQLRRLRDDPSLLDTAVEEVLRWASPQVHFRRTATVDTELRGVPIAAGDKVVTWYVAANFDPDQFPDPFRFDVGRTPNRHVTFGGGGPHLCLGQWMARLEVRTFLQALVDHVDEVELRGPVERVRSNFINGVKRLPIALRAR